MAAIAISITIFALWPTSADQADNGDQGGVTLQPGQPVNDSTLATVSPNAFFWSFFRRQITAKTTELTSATFDTHAEFSKKQFTFVRTIGYDYASKKLNIDSTGYSSSKAHEIERCIDGSYHWLELDEGQWSQTASPETGDCTVKDPTASIGLDDNVATGGLNNSQADAYINSLRNEYKGFVKAAAPTLLQANGTQYIRMSVDFGPTKLGDGEYWGNQIFTWAFKKTGLDPNTWPFNNGLGGGMGLHVVYYLDTKTLLPAYSAQTETPVLGDDGKLDPKAASPDASATPVR